MHLKDNIIIAKKTLVSVIFTLNKKIHICVLRSDATHLNEVVLQFDNAHPHLAIITQDS